MTVDATRTVLNISKHDVIGRRFNNLDVAPAIARYGWSSHFCSWTPPQSALPVVSQARKGFFARKWDRVAPLVEVGSGAMDLFFRNSGSICDLESYRGADLLHFHIVHERWLSAADWLRIGTGKPLVWTWHDPYFMTGHCIYPMDCRGYLTGCQTCHHLDYHFPIRIDRAAKNLERKVQTILSLDPLVIVASRYMERMVKESVYGERVRLRVVPFGVEWPAQEDKLAARQQLGIPPHHLVIGFRAVYSDYKGLPLIKDALAQLASTFGGTPLTIIAFQETGTLRDLPSSWTILEPGWISGKDISRYYSAMDVFLMPSRAEAFGMMAIEAMAAGALPIVTYGTALPELVAAPIHGLAVEHSAEGLSSALFSVLRNVHHWEESRPARRAFALSKYSVDKFAANLTQVYNEEYAHYCCNRRAAR